MKIIQITDLHLVSPGDRLFDTDPLERLRAALADIAARHADADLLAVTGDLAHGGEPEAYAALRAALADVLLPVRFLIGNHDDRGGFRAAFPGAPVDEAGFVQSALDTSAGRLLFLDTSEPGTHEGRLCERRLAWLSARLAEAPRGACRVFMHHPPGLIGYAPCDAIGLRGGGAVLDVLSRHAVQHVFFGHVHRPVSGSWRGVPFSALRGLNHQVWLDFTVRDGIPCSLEPPCYAVILLEPGSTVVHLHDFLDPSPKYLYRPDLPASEQVRPLG